MFKYLCLHFQITIFSITGIEAVLRAIDLAFKVKNNELMHRGITLLSSILERQVVIYSW